MKKEIAKNKYYEAYVDEELNRAYWVFKGKCDNVMQIPNLKQDHKEVLSHLKPGFTVLSDLRTFEVPAPEVTEVMAESAKISENAGIKRQAHVINKKDMEAIRASRGAMKTADMDLKMMQFDSYEEAEKWLDM